MSCSQPNYLIDFGVDDRTHKHVTKFVKRDLALRNLGMLKYYHNDGVTKVYSIPCGKCPSCISSYRKQWALRCEAEAKLHKVSCFITLTYDEDHRPKALCKDDLKKFIKALRNRGKTIRYFGCGEYSPAGLPHYHIILFGYMPDDLSVICKSKSGFCLYKSKFIENIWSKGLCTVQEFDSGVASYVAGYCEKKLDQEDSFLIMSNRPGIAHDYYIKNLFKLYENDQYQGKNGLIASLPRYCDKIADQFFMDISDIKEKRQKKQNDLSVASLNAHGFSLFEEVFENNGDILSRSRKYARSL